MFACLCFVYILLRWCLWNVKSWITLLPPLILGPWIRKNLFFGLAVLFKIFIYINWRLITVFWWVLPYIDMNQPWVYMCPPSWTPLPPPSLSHPSGLSQCPGFECPVSCIKLGLLIYFTYGNINVSVLFSQIIPPLPSQNRVQKSVLYICVSFAVSCIGSSLPSF